MLISIAKIEHDKDLSRHIGFASAFIVLFIRDLKAGVRHIVHSLCLLEFPTAWRDAEEPSLLKRLRVKGSPFITSFLVFRPAEYFLNVRKLTSSYSELKKSASSVILKELQELL